MLKIRLSRAGKNTQPSFRLIVQEHTAPVKGKFVEELGYYRPATPDKPFTFNSDRVKYWISVGATPSDTVATLLKKQGVEGMEQYMEPRDKKRKSRAAAEQSEAEAPSASAASTSSEEKHKAKKEEPAPAASANEVSASSEEKAEAKKEETATAPESAKTEEAPAAEEPAPAPEEAKAQEAPKAEAPQEQAQESSKS